MAHAEPPLVIRRALRGDAPRVADVLVASRRAFLPYAPLAHTEREVRDWVREVLIPEAEVTVADQGGALVAVMAVRREAVGSWIDQLYVAPGHVGCGIGTRLLAQALAGLPRPIRLFTFQQNARARAFYERHGFVAVAFGDGTGNEEGCPDVRYELPAPTPRTA
jgi:GNAT superfamily N-acetyltransferase